MINIVLCRYIIAIVHICSCLFLLQVEWFRDGTAITLGGRIDMHVSSEKHSLLVRHIKDTDFGNYMCQASNNLGSSQQFIQLSGIPNIPVFQKSSRRLGPDGYRLVWQVDTYSAIIQYLLKFREREVSITQFFSKLTQH